MTAAPSAAPRPSAPPAGVDVRARATLDTLAPGARASDQPRRSAARFALWWLAGLIICFGWDRAVWLAASGAGTPTLAWLEGANSTAGLSRIASDRGALSLIGATIYAGVYFFGRLWIWLALAIVLIFRGWAGTSVDRVRQALREGVFVALVPALAGLGAEALKLITRRQRPEAADGVWSFKTPSGSALDPEFWSAGGLGMASSHAAVALGAALATGVIFPKLRGPLLVLAALCCLSRLLVGAHYLSDVYVGATLAILIFAFVRTWDARNNPGRPLSPLARPAHPTSPAQA